MIKKIIEYTDINENLEEIESIATVLFFYTLKSIKNYEQKTRSNFFEDYDKALDVVFDIAGDIFSGSEEEKLTNAQKMSLVPLMNNTQINQFLMNAIPCMYAKIENGRIIQNEETVQEAEDSLWIMNLVNPGFFVEIFSEMSKIKLKEPDKKTDSKKK